MLPRPQVTAVAQATMAITAAASLGGAQLRECKSLFIAAHARVGYALGLEARGPGRRRNSEDAESGAGGQTTYAQQQ